MYWWLITHTGSDYQETLREQLEDADDDDYGRALIERERRIQALAEAV